MKTIKINGIEIEFEDGLELSVEGSKITIKGGRVEHHYHYSSGTPFQPLFQPPSIYPIAPAGPCTYQPGTASQSIGGFGVGLMGESNTLRK